MVEMICFTILFIQSTSSLVQISVSAHYYSSSSSRPMLLSLFKLTFLLSSSSSLPIYFIISGHVSSGHYSITLSKVSQLFSVLFSFIFLFIISSFSISIDLYTFFKIQTCFIFLTQIILVVIIKFSIYTILHHI